MLGGPELEDYVKFLGWDANTYIMADLIDTVRENTAVYIGSKSEDRKVPTFDPYPRPDTQKVKPKQSLDDFAGGLATLFGPGHI